MSTRYDRCFILVKCLIVVYIFFYIIANIVFLYKAVKQVSDAEDLIVINERLQHQYQYNKLHFKDENNTQNWINELHKARHKSKSY